VAVVPVPLLAQRLLDQTVDLIAFFDRRRRIREYSAYGRKLSSSSAQGARKASYYQAEQVWLRDVAGPQACPPGEWTLERFRSGVALMEAFSAQLSELRALPTIEPNRRLAS
jgi:hypothetical protein